MDFLYDTQACGKLPVKVTEFVKLVLKGQTFIKNPSFVKQMLLLSS